MSCVSPPNTAIVEGKSTITTTSTTYVLATGMTTTPPAGVYAVMAGAHCSGSLAASRVLTSLFSGGVQVIASERTIGGVANMPAPTSMLAILTLDGASAIELRWRITGGGTATMIGRQLMLLRLQ
jgi:hypothetical protein